MNWLKADRALTCIISFRLQCYAFDVVGKITFSSDSDLCKDIEGTIDALQKFLA
ncbi:uncharacterized protein BO66DRAFT_396489 [Aspergillus aculeatinus CBS 121060]|uniref:Uncharacterized protein n=1 Tax=Aspergillus aculeatinus CBS 121060 TaxID=1448322 RepID=A0ACD1GRM0_9EURO|nr:hypothetical protein BO66DRAFT_396489 [Aspergillus aculeatinus CBS 121060]RAH64076.1 hypothetical protein BO66DRAFT_396489 [Aspergillus aculeatinus CBS 121060]